MRPEFIHSYHLITWLPKQGGAKGGSKLGWEAWKSAKTSTDRVPWGTQPAPHCCSPGPAKANWTGTQRDIFTRAAFTPRGLNPSSPAWRGAHCPKQWPVAPRRSSSVILLSLGHCADTALLGPSLLMHVSLYLDICILLPFPSGLTPSILLNPYIWGSEQRQPDFCASWWKRTILPVRQSWGRREGKKEKKEVKSESNQVSGSEVSN